MAAFLFCSALASGCAIMNKDNRLVLNSLDEAMQGSAIIDSTAGKIAAAPVALPVGMAAGVIDMAVVTPARATVPAGKDTVEYLWENPQGSDLRQAMLFIPKVVATPVLFISDWAVRSIFTTKF
ncbi:hypothetical protein FO488_12110 [Geobacter sp. FeAm09]|uniref:hypothetical protein n=1 Tax=Geobacter sp. FeAm09 TaxID=2597769 RepID=UPI0011EBEE45|nr:hypothetical protein [Geobacter sp. FeAm09]QEM68828.1 hypothetical protein FO488_12110 [Geobacter sp. FeAm09]